MWTARSRGVEGSALVLALAGGAIAFVTLTPGVPYADWNPVGVLRQAGWRGVAEVSANLALFVPFGVALGMRGLGLLAACATGVLTSLCIEVLQIVVPGRFPAVSDVLANGLGAALGAGLFWTAPWPWLRMCAWVARATTIVRAPGPRAARWLAALAVVLPAMLAMSGAALSLPPRLTRPLRVAETRVVLDDRLSLGRANGTAGFCGAVDEVLVFSRGLAASEIRDESARGSTAAMSRPRPEGLAAAWSFDASIAAGSAVASAHELVDITEARGAERTRGRIGDAVLLTHPGAYARLRPSPELARLGSAFTVMAWVQPHRACGSSILDVAAGAVFLWAGTPQEPLSPVAGGRFGRISERVSWRNELPVGAWTHLALTFDGDALQLHVDGERVHTRLVATSTLRSASVGREPVPPGGALHAAPWPFDRTRPLRLTLSGESGAPPRRRALLRLHGAARDTVWMARTPDNALLVRYKPKGSDLGLPPVSYRVRGDALPADWGGSARVDVGGTALRGWVRINDRSPVGFGLRPAEWWRRLGHMDELPGWLPVVVTALLAAAASFPAGFYSRFLDSGRWWAVAPVVLLPGVAWAVPMAMPTVVDLALGVAGVVAGRTAARRASGRHLSLKRA